MTDGITRAEVVRQLRIGPNTLRRVMSAYEDVLGPLTDGKLSEEQLRTVETIVALQAEGVGPERLRAMLAQTQGGEEAAPAAEMQPSDELASTLTAIRENIERAEERRMEDRDRLLTALVRTQQELAQLRQEVALGRSRRDRKRGFFSRLFG